MTTRSYDQVKEYNGKRYTGMLVGRSHTWRYDPGEWKERKVTPDRWDFRYAVVKRRAGRAPEGSGAPLGTSHHWYIVANQIVTKLDANSYMTEMVGHKIKIAHRRAGQSAWNASERAQRKQLVKLLRELADDLESRPLEEQAASNGAPAAANGHRAQTARRTDATASSKRTAHRASRPARSRPARAHRTSAGARMRS